MKRILVIDDEEIIRIPISEALSRSGYEVHSAGDGKQGLALFNANPIDLVITDLIMPDTEGLETIMALRKLRPDLKIIAISGGAFVHGSQYLKLAQRLGADRVLAKPFSLSELKITVDALMNPPPAAQPDAPAPA